MKPIALIAICLFALAVPVAASADPPPQDESWLQTSISGDRFEIAGGKIALARSQNGSVRALAQRLIKDHTQSLHDAIQLAEQWGMKPPPSATPSEQWELHRLRYMPKNVFDIEYASLEVKDHNQDIEETGFEARDGQASSVRQEAKKDLPMLNMHLRLAKATVKSVAAAPST
jgi:putative membrane protein